MRKLILVSTAAVMAIGLTSATLDAQQRGPRGRGSEPPAVAAGENQRDPRPGNRETNPRFQGPNRPAVGLLLPGVRAGRLDLTAEQRDKLRDILADVRTKTAPVRSELRKAEGELRATLFAETRNDAGVREAAAKVAELRNQMTDIRITASAAVAEVLTPEQREQLRSVPERRVGPRSDRGPGNRMMRRPAPASGD